MRFHRIDAWRASLLLLGVFVHSAGLYVRSVGGTNLAIFILFSSLFRMETYFTIAGFFAAISLEKRNLKTFINQRMLVLGVPLLTMSFTTNVVMWCLSVSKAKAPDFLNLNHLWFLATLLVAHFVHCFMIKKAPLLLKRPLNPYGLFILLLIAVFVAIGTQLTSMGADRILRAAMGQANANSVSKTFIRSPYYLTFYFVGALFAANKNLLKKISNKPIVLVGPTALLITTFTVTYIGLENYIAAGRSTIELAMYNTLPPVIGLLMAAFVICSGLTDSKSSRLVSLFSSASYTIYLLHYPILIITSSLIAYVASDPFSKFILSFSLAFLLSLIVQIGLVRRVPLFALLLNGRLQATVEPQPNLNNAKAA